jgi:ubiquinol-cytochrome c reductase cytochrome c1 subunit
MKASLHHGLALLGIGALIASGVAVARAADTAAPDAAISAAHDAPQPERQSWSFAGPFGKYDPAQLQRGFKVYREVCATCHSLTRVAFRTLAEEGGPEFSEEQVKALAAEYQVKDEPNDKGEVKDRPGRPSDYFPKVAYGGAGNPPDMSVLAKARSYSRGFPMFLIDALLQYQEHGVDYVYALLNGYRDPPDEMKKEMGDLYYNVYMPGHKIAMPPPLDVVFGADGKPSDANFYTDGTPVTKEQVSKDVAAFMMWAAEPKLVERKQTGFKVMAFLILLAGLLYFTKKKVWADVHAAAHG